MDIKGFLDHLSKRDKWRKKIWTEEELESLAGDIDDQEAAKAVKMLFSYEMAQHEPHPDTKEFQERMRKSGQDEGWIAENSSYIEMAHYDNEWTIQEAVRDALFIEKSMREKGLEYDRQSLDWWCELEEF